MKTNNRKQGEENALKILKSKGISFNEEHIDNGQAGQSVPDLQYSNGRYLEVTHTLHDHKLTKPEMRDYNKKTIQEQCGIAQKASNAYKRIRNRDYPTEPGIKGTLTQDGLNQFSRDKKVVERFFGKKDERTGKRSEFKCDMPIVEFSSENILREIQEKGKKYSNEITDLFIFVTEDEYKSMMHLIETQKYNASYCSFMQMISSSPFKTIYVCIWMFEEQRYDVDNPTIMKFWKSGGKLHYQEI